MASLTLKPLLHHALKRIEKEQKGLRKAAARAIRNVIKTMNGREQDWSEKEQSMLSDLLPLMLGYHSDAITETRTAAKESLVSLHEKLGSTLETFISQKIGVDDAAGKHPTTKDET